MGGSGRLLVPSGSVTRCLGFRNRVLLPTDSGLGSNPGGGGLGTAPSLS